MTAVSPTVWHISSNRWNSAITEYALSTARACELAGYSSHFTPLSGSPAEVRARAYDLDVEPLERFSLTSIPRLRSLHAQINPQVIIVYGGSETFLTKFANTPVIRFRGQAIERDGWLHLAQQKLSLSHVNLMISPSRRLAKACEALADVPVLAIPLGIDTDRFHRIPHADKGERPVVTILGRFDPVKGHAAAFRIFAQVAKRHSDLNPLLRVVGLPANLSEVHLRKSADEAGLSDNQIEYVIEKVSDLAAMMTATTVGWVPSIGSEIICRVAEEFLLCGTPVVANDVGSLTECAHGEYGDTYTSEVEAADVLSQRLLESWKETDSIKEKRATRAREEFSLQSMATSLRDALSLVTR